METVFYSLFVYIFLFIYIFLVHYYNYDLNGWDPNIYPKPRFTSEYGFQSYPSLTAWNSVLGQEDNLTELMDHRQHSPLGNTPIEALISKNLPLPSNDLTNYNEALIYMSQISQAMAIKMETEVYRYSLRKNL